MDNRRTPGDSGWGAYRGSIWFARYLTFATNGDVWFTDSSNNAIVRVPRSALTYTNVDPGDGSVFTVAAPLGTVAGGKTLVVKQDRVVPGQGGQEGDAEAQADQGRREGRHVQAHRARVALAGQGRTVTTTVKVRR